MGLHTILKASAYDLLYQAQPALECFGRINLGLETLLHHLQASALLIPVIQRAGLAQMNKPALYETLGLDTMLWDAWEICGLI